MAYHRNRRHQGFRYISSRRAKSRQRCSNLQWISNLPCTFSYTTLLTRDHRQAVAHGDRIGACAIGADLGSRVQVLFREAERPNILTENRDIFPSESFEPLTGDVAEGRRKINQVDAREERLDWYEGIHSLDIVSGLSVKRKSLCLSVINAHPVPPPI